MKNAFPWSYTKLSCYETCPAQAGYRWDQKLPRPQKSVQAARGTEAHESIENYLGGQKKTLHEAIIPFGHVVQALRKRKPLVEERIGIAVDWKLAEWKKAWGWAVLDSVVPDIQLVDIQEWKTGKIWDSHADQRRLYLLAGRVKWPHAKGYRVQTYYFDQGTKKVLEMTNEELDEVQADFTARLTIMSLDDVMAPRPGYYCSWCDFAKQKGGPCRHG